MDQAVDTDSFGRNAERAIEQLGSHMIKEVGSTYLGCLTTCLSLFAFSLTSENRLPSLVVVAGSSMVR